MGILNVTPDSFSDGGRYLDTEAAVQHGRMMFADGADVVDVGGESTRPGATEVSIDEELARVIPVIEALAAVTSTPTSATTTTISVDTRHAEVARAAVAAGATVLNDVSASLWAVAAELGVGWIAMHMGGIPATMQDRPRYDDVVREVREHLEERAALATGAGVERIWIDPGFGFGKTVRHNIELVASIDEFVDTGIPVVLGVSRKATLGVLSADSDRRIDATVGPSTGPDDRLEAGIALATWAMRSGVAMIRVHDVRPHVQAARVVAGSIPPAAKSAA